MILSHKYRFIFIKTVKTAGTSLEIALSRFCGPDDIITPISPSDEATRRSHGHRGPQNFRYPVWQWPTLERRALLYAFYNKRLPFAFYSHMPADAVRRAVGPEIWRSYYKFTIARYPVDRILSLYYWEREWNGFSADLSTFLRCRASQIDSNWRIVSENDGFMLDDFIRYEHFKSDLIRVGERLNLPESLAEVFGGMSAKSGIRPRDATADSLLGSEERAFVDYLCRPEIQAFGYPTKAQPRVGSDRDAKP